MREIEPNLSVQAPDAYREQELPYVVIGEKPEVAQSAFDAWKRTGKIDVLEVQ
jgi:hypothetical protein